MTKEEYVSHQKNECENIEITCVDCEHSYKRCDFNNKELHWCERNLKAKIDKLRAQIKEENEVVKAQEKEAKNVEMRIKDYERRIENMKKKNEEYKVDIEKTQMNLDQIKGGRYCDDASVLIDKSQLIELKVPKQAMEVRCSDAETNLDLIKDLFENQNGLTTVSGLGPESWIEIDFKKPALINGMGFIFNQFYEGENRQIIKPKGLKIYAKEFTKDTPKEEKVDKIEEKKADEDHEQKLDEKVEKKEPKPEKEE